MSRSSKLLIASFALAAVVVQLIDHFVFTMSPTVWWILVVVFASLIYQSMLDQLHKEAILDSAVINQRAVAHRTAPGGPLEPGPHLLPCAACNNPISSAAAACPKCGHPNAQT